MAHIRETIRTAVINSLTGLTTTGNRVYSNRVDPYLTLPSLNVLTQNESVRNDMCDMSSIQVRELRLVIEARADATTIPDDELDTIANEVEEAIADSEEINALVFDIILDTTSFSYTSDGQKPIGLLEMQYSLLYQVDGNHPSTIV